MKPKNMTYREHSGSIEFSEDDHCYYGKVLFIDDLVTYEAADHVQLRREFHRALDHYLGMRDSDALAPAAGGASNA